MKNKLILLLLLLGQGCRPAMATDRHTELVQLTAHLGASYAITMVSYGAYTKEAGLAQQDAIFLALLTTIAAGIAYKVVEGGNDYVPATMKNMVGAFGAIGTIKLYEW